MKNKYLIIGIVMIIICLVLLVSLYDLLQEAKKEKLEGELKSLIRGEEIETAAGEDFIFTFWQQVIDHTALSSVDEMMTAGFTHASITFGPNTSQIAEDIIRQLRNKSYKIALENSAGYSYQVEKPEIVTGDDDFKFLTAPCINKATCDNWNNVELALDPSYTGELWQNTLNNTWNITKRANPDIVLFDCEYWQNPQTIDAYFNSLDPGQNCSCNVTKDGIGYDNYRKNWSQRYLELNNTVKQVNPSIEVYFFGDINKGGRTWIQNFDGSYVYLDYKYLTEGAGDYPNPNYYFLPNLELLEKNIQDKDNNLSGAVPWVSFVYMTGHSNYFDKYYYNTRDVNRCIDLRGDVRFDPSVSREAGRMLRQAGAGGFAVYPSKDTFNWNGTCPFNSYGDYWLNHSIEMIEGFLEEDYIEKNKIRNPGFESWKTKADNVSKINNTPAGLVNERFIPVFWNWTDSNPIYNDGSVFADLTTDKQSGMYAWRNTRFGEIGNRTIYSGNFSITENENYIFSIWTKTSFIADIGKIKFSLVNLNGLVEEKIGEVNFTASWNEFKENISTNPGSYELKILMEDNTGQQVDIYLDNVSLLIRVECGDGNCNGDEDCSICAEDCGECPCTDCGDDDDNGDGGGGCIPENKTKTCLNMECGARLNNCSRSVDCGNCSVGFNCASGRCINATGCVAETKETTCSNWSCGIKNNNCGETIVCGSCEGEERCENGKCKAKETPKPSKIIELIKKYYLYGIIVLLVIGIFIILFLTISKLKRKKKISSLGEKVRIEGRIREAKNLILEAKRKGYSDDFIKKLFLNKGWNEKLVERLMEEAEK